MREHEEAELPARTAAARAYAEDRRRQADYDARRAANQMHASTKSEREAKQSEATAQQAEALVRKLETPSKKQACRCSLCGRLCDMGVPRWCTRCKAARATNQTPHSVATSPAVPSVSDSQAHTGDDEPRATERSAPQPVATSLVSELSRPGVSDRQACLSESLPASASVLPRPHQPSPAAPSTPSGSNEMTWKPLLPSAMWPPPRPVIEAYKMLEDADSLEEHLLASALSAAVKDKYGCDYSVDAEDWDERICEFAGCDFYVPPECRDCMHDICSRCRPKHKCARFVGDWHSRDVVLKSDAVLEHEWRTDREGCNRRDRERLEQLRSNMCKALESHTGVSTAQWAEWELSPLGSDFIDKARTIYAPPHEFKLPLASGPLEYDHIEMMWRCPSATCTFCRGTSRARYCERRGGGVNEGALASAMERSQYLAQYPTAVQRDEEIRSDAHEQMKRREAHTATEPRPRCAAGCLCHEPFWDLQGMMEAYLSKDEIAQLTTRRDVQTQSPTENSRALAQQLMAVAMERKVGVPRDECARAIVAVRDRDKVCYVQYRDQSD